MLTDEAEINRIVGRLREIVTGCGNFVASDARLTMPQDVLDLWRSQALQLTEAADLIEQLKSGWATECDMVAVLTEQCNGIQETISRHEAKALSLSATIKRQSEKLEEGELQCAELRDGFAKVVRHNEAQAATLKRQSTLLKELGDWWAFIKTHAPDPGSDAYAELHKALARIAEEKP